MLRDCPFGGPDARLPYVLLHPRQGVVLLEPAPLRLLDAVARLRARLEAVRFSAIFPGDLPILHLTLGPEGFAGLGERLDAALSQQPPLNLAGGETWVAAVERALLAERPLPEPPAWRLRRQTRPKRRRLFLLGLGLLLTVVAAVGATLLLRPRTAPTPVPIPAAVPARVAPPPVVALPPAPLPVVPEPPVAVPPPQAEPLAAPAVAEPPPVAAPPARRPPRASRPVPVAEPAEPAPPPVAAPPNRPARVVRPAPVVEAAPVEPAAPPPVAAPFTLPPFTLPPAGTAEAEQPTGDAARHDAMLARCRRVFAALRHGAPVGDADLGFFDRWCQVR
jgi:hypothetical protein